VEKGHNMGPLSNVPKWVAYVLPIEVHVCISMITHWMDITDWMDKRVHFGNIALFCVLLPRLLATHCKCQGCAECSTFAVWQKVSEPLQILAGALKSWKHSDTCRHARFHHSGGAGSKSTEAGPTGGLCNHGNSPPLCLKHLCLALITNASDEVWRKRLHFFCCGAFGINSTSLCCMYALPTLKCAGRECCVFKKNSSFEGSSKENLYSCKLWVKF